MRYCRNDKWADDVFFSHMIDSHYTVAMETTSIEDTRFNI